MKVVLLPLSDWLQANTNLFILSLDKQTRKYRQYFLKLEHELAMPINTTSDLMFNSRLFLSQTESEMLVTLNRDLPGHENYLFTLKVFENTEGTIGLPLRALLAESIIVHFKRLNKFEMRLEHGFILTQCVNDVDRPSLPSTILEEPNVNRDVIANQRSVHATLQWYCNLNDAVLTTQH